MFSFRLVPGWLFALALDAIHQFDETWILVHIGPVWIRLKPLVVFVAETDGSLQPSQRFDLATLQKVSRGEPVRNVVIGFGNLPDFRRELFVSLRVLSLRAETDCEDGPDTVDLRMLLQNLLKDLDRVVNLAFIVKNTGGEDSDYRVFRFDLEALGQLTLRFFILALIHENARAVVTRQHAFARIQAHHAIETAQRFFIIAVESRNYAAHKPHARIVWILISQQINFRARLLFLTAGEINEHHVHARFEQSRIELQRFAKRVLRLLLIAGLAESFQHAIDVTTAECGIGKREVRIDLDRAAEVFDS